VAQLRAQLGDQKTAESAWKEVMDLDEGDREAHGHLAHIFETQERWHDLIDILRIAARFAQGPDEEHAFRTRIAQIYQDTLGELDDAVEAWQSVVDLRGDDMSALSQLEKVHAGREDWLAVQEVLNRRLDAVSTNADRIDVFRRLALVSEQKRQSIDEAIGYLHQILDIDNAEMATYAELERLLAAAERWHDLVEILQRVGDVVGTLGDTRREIEYLAKAADVWEGPLENPDAAGEILEKILKREPNYVPAFNRLARIYESQGEWEKCSEILQRALALGPQGRDAADLYFRLGEMERRTGDNPGQAAQYFGEALKYDSTHPHTVRAVEEIARDSEDWGVVADMLQRRESVEADEAARLELVLEIAEIFRTRLGQPDAAIPALERAAQAAPEDPRVLGPLADLYFAAGRHLEAQPIYEALADEARSKRRMKDVAKYRQRIGGIAEASGQMDVALAAYEEAFRVNPTDVATMAGLGRIYLADQNWEKARRVYRSMVLQNIDPGLGITKAEVYYALGNIHVQLGENAKAKGMYQRGLELEPDNQALKQALAAVQ
jgi:tetratricopeptide (TPR) repeat protein